MKNLVEKIMTAIAALMVVTSTAFAAPVGEIVTETNIGTNKIILLVVAIIAIVIAIFVSKMGKNK